MKTRILLGVVIGLAVAPWGTVSAQVPYTPPMTSPFYHPPVSPYINLLRAGSSPAVNYYGVVRPELQNYAFANAFQQQINANQQGISGLQQGVYGPVSTGHGVAFLNTGGYFLNLNPLQGQAGFLRGTTGTTAGLAGQATSTAFNRPGGVTTGVGTRPTIGTGAGIGTTPGIGTSPFGR